MKTTVLIVGAGPTGLTLACELARRSIPFEIIDRATEYPQGSRAKGLQPRSLEVFNDLGIAKEIIENGTFDLPYRRFERDKIVGEAKRSNYPRKDAQYSQTLIIPQWKIEEILRKKLASYKIEVRLDTTLVSFTQDAATVTAQVKTANTIDEIQCDYMVACDGGKSNTRKALGIQFVGETHEEERLLVGDVTVEGLKPDAWHIWMLPPYPFGFALCPFACSDTWQLQAILLPDEQGHLPEPSIEAFNRIFQERTGMKDVVLKDAGWQSVYRVNVRMADQYKVGRIFIAGDAAHAHSIAGGLGMNTGIQDAYNLGWKLASVINEESSITLLDTYAEERRPIAAWTLNISSERQKIMSEVGLKGMGGFESISSKDTTQLDLGYPYSSLSAHLKENDEGLKAGNRAPDLQFEDGSWLFDLYRGIHFTILGVGNTEAVVDRFNHLYPNKIKAYHILDEKMKAVFGNEDHIYVIRPDGYIGMIAAPKDEAAIEAYLNRFFEVEE